MAYFDSLFRILILGKKGQVIAGDAILELKLDAVKAKTDQNEPKTLVGFCNELNLACLNLT